jgi:hypothetical protein
LFLAFLQDRQGQSRRQVRWEPLNLSSAKERLFRADILCRRYINLVNATPDELEQLTQACEPASFGVKQENVLGESYRKTGKMDSECFASMLDPFNTDLMKIVRGYLLEGLKSKNDIIAELCKLNVYGAHLIIVHSGICYYVAVQVKAHSSSLTWIPPAVRKCLAPSSLSFQLSMKVEPFSFGTMVMNGSSTLPKLLRPSTSQR